MRKLICECCGAPINPRTYKCEYCGTAYEREVNGNVVRIETFQNPVREYKAGVEVPAEAVSVMNEHGAANYAIEQLSRNLAEAIAECMQLHTHYDPRSMNHIVTARIKIIEPAERFR